MANSTSQYGLVPHNYLYWTLVNYKQNLVHRFFDKSWWCFWVGNNGLWKIRTPLVEFGRGY